MKLPSILQLIAIFVLGLLIMSFVTRDDKAKTVPMNYSELVKLLDDEPGTITGITIVNGSNEALVERKDLQPSIVTLPAKAGEQSIIEIARKAKVSLVATEKPQPGLGETILGLLFHPLTIMLVLGWFFLSGRVKAAGGMLERFQSSGATVYAPTKEKKTFADVAGCTEALTELEEVVQYLRDPKSFIELGAKLPRGVLLIGGPGNGKTLLAKAVAGEANVPFFALSASQFIEMLVGAGAARARDLFNQARKNMPCIIFIDELDAIGRRRGVGMGGGNDEREQTLNEILVQMDGFTENEAIVLIAATNRPDILDPAVVRSGRFDRHVQVDSPDMKGRADILRIHVRNRPLAPEVDVDVLAGLTPGFSGADLAAACNEAATVARRRLRSAKNLLGAGALPKTINMSDFSEGIDRVMMGPARPRLMSSDDKRNTAVHEAGHASVGYHLKGNAIRKVTIMPRAKALGFSLSVADRDRYNYTDEELKVELASMMGGRVAQKVILGKIDSGAANDFTQATKLARRMVGEFGMSKLGHISIASSGGSPFGRASMEDGGQDGWGPTILDAVDREVQALLDEATARAHSVITERRLSVEAISERLLQKETILGDEFAAVWAASAPVTPANPVVASGELTA